ncbi:glycosyltransferase family 39 protein [candidate division FCPU426 bacterium]|nr:glycosyltransferase family 39 protein [candidate division FCPU426 bacterium]
MRSKRHEPALPPWLEGLRTRFNAWSAWLNPGLLALAMLFAWVGQEQLFGRHLANGLWLWVFAALFAGLAFIRKPERLPSALDHQPKWEALVLGLIVVVAGFVRLWRLQEIPNGFYFDEAMNALVGLQIMEDPHYLPIFGPADAPAPTLFHYFNVVALSLFGVSARAAKMVPVAAGIATVPLFYFLVRRLVSRPVALAATLAFALMRWHINFSRINFIGILTPLYGAAAAYFLLRGLETKNRWHMALSGLSVALGLYTYYASNLIPFVLGPYLALQLAWDRRFLKEHWQGLLIFLAVSLAVFAPLGYFALTEKHRFFARNHQVLIFNHVQPEQALSALWRNVKTTLLMFNYFGDCNGRHNLPEEPMLSPLAGLFFGLGLIWSLTQIHRPHAFLVLWWFVVALVPGFLTIEAPQGYRCIGAIVPVSVMIALGLERFWQGIQELGQGTRYHSWLWVVLALVVAMMGVRNLTDYFDRQAKHMACWSEFSAAEASMGNRIRALGPEYHTYISAGSYDYPTIRFLGHGSIEAEPFQIYSSIPSNYTGTKNLSYMLLPIHDNALEILRYYYPQGRETVHGSPFDFDLFTSYEVGREEVLATRGLNGIYTDAAGHRLAGQEGQESFSFLGSAHGLQAPVTAQWRGSLRIPQWGLYHFKMQGAAGARMVIDGKRAGEQGLHLAEGMHTLSIHATIASVPGPVQFLWKRGEGGPWNVVPAYALSVHDSVYGLLGKYYRSTDRSGEALFQRIDPFISLLGQDFSLAAPFSVRWEGTLDISRPGRYGFGTMSNEFSWVAVNGQEVVANEVVDQYAEGTITLPQGKHAIRIDYTKRSGSYPRIILYWTPPGKAKEKVPFHVLSPS